MTFIDDLRAAVQALTEADDYYADIPIITEELGDIEAAINERVGRAGGVALLLVTPVIGGVLANVPGANFRDIAIIARVFENRKVNATGKHALNIALHTAALWSQAKPDALAATLTPDEPTIVLGNDERFTTYDVFFKTEAGERLPIPQLAAPEIDASNAAAITVDAHPTPGAAIFYTLNGTQPSPRNGTLYTAPFAGNDGDTLRVRAWLAGFLPSTETTTIITTP